MAAFDSSTKASTLQPGRRWVESATAAYKKTFNRSEWRYSSANILRATSMNQQKTSSFFIDVLTLCVLLVTVSGCGSGGVTLGTVSGHVTKAGKPQQGITVILEPV